MVPGILQVESAPNVFCMQFGLLVSFPNILTSPLFQRIYYSLLYCEFVKTFCTFDCIRFTADITGLYLELDEFNPQLHTVPLRCSLILSSHLHLHLDRAAGLFSSGFQEVKTIQQNFVKLRILSFLDLK